MDGWIGLSLQQRNDGKKKSQYRLAIEVIKQWETDRKSLENKRRAEWYIPLNGKHVASSSTQNESISPNLPPRLISFSLDSQYDTPYSHSETEHTGITK